MFISEGPIFGANEPKRGGGGREREGWEREREKEGLPRPRLDKSNSYQISGAKQVPQMIGFLSVLFFSFFLHPRYRSLRILVTIGLGHSTQNFFRFFDSSSGGQPARRLRN